jgi:transcriptional regulator with XRE-family HTH domain
MFNKKIADRIREARRMAGVTQSQAALALGVHRGTLGHWERGEGHRPASKNLERLAEAFDVNYEWLATGRGIARGLPLDAIPAVRLDCFAHSEEEEKLLVAFRKLSGERQRAVLKLLDD